MANTPHVAWIVALAVLAQPLESRAQEGTPLDLLIGQHVLLVIRQGGDDESEKEGRLLAISEETLTLEDENGWKSEIPRSRILRAQRKVGRKAWGTKGALVGASAAVPVFVLGVLFGAAFECSDVDADPECLGRSIEGGDLVRNAAAISAAVGVATAIVFSRAIKRDVWIEVPLGRVKVGLGPNGHGPGASLSIRF